MADSPLLAKSKAFALEIIRVCNEIKRNQKESYPDIIENHAYCFEDSQAKVH